MADSIDFQALTLRDALDLAVLIEEEARERYLEFADQMEKHATPEAAAFFRAMSRNEELHGAKLRARRRELFGDAPRGVTRAMLFDVEAPEYDEPRAFMTARQAMEVALRAEEKAHAFFVEALPRVEDAEVRRLFEELREEEAMHRSLVRDAMRRLPEGPEPDAEDYVDDPVAQ